MKHLLKESMKKITILTEDLSKGNFGYPWEGTLAAVPQILPHIALYNHYIIHISVVYVGIYLGYSPRVPNFSLSIYHLSSPFHISHRFFFCRSPRVAAAARRTKGLGSCNFVISFSNPWRTTSHPEGPGHPLG